MGRKLLEILQMKVALFTLLLLSLNQAQSQIPSESSTLDTPPISSYTLSDKVWIGTEVFQITYLNQTHFIQPTALKMTLLVADGEWVSQDTPLATSNSEKLHLEKRSYLLEKSQLSIDLKELKKEQRKFIQSIRAEIATLKEELKKIQILHDNPSLPENLKQKSLSVKQELLESIQELEEELKPEQLALTLDNQKEELEIRFLKAEQSYRELEDNSTILAPFEGRLEYLIKDMELNQPVRIDSGEEYISLTNDEEVQFVCSPSSEYLKLAQPLQVTIEIDMLDKKISAHFHNQLITTKSNRRLKQLAFRTEEKREDLIKHINTSRMGQVYYNFEKPCYLVPKKNILSLYPEILEKEGWRGLAKKLWPEQELVYIAPKHLAIGKP